ncbi:MAG: M3 family metallopeptidase, partial [Planctomycetota bacterium]
MTQATDSDSALLQPWSGPYGGVPPWHLVRPDEFVDAFKAAIELAKAENDEIANQTAPATFENTLKRMETAGLPLQRLIAIYGVHSSNLKVGPMPEIERVVMPMLAEYDDSRTQNEKLFKRIEAVYEGDEMQQLSPAEQRIVDDTYKSFVRQGAKLNAEDKQRLSNINKRLAGLFADFSQNVLDDEQGYVTWIDDESQLAGLPDSVRAAMAAAAEERADDKGVAGKWAVTNTRSSMEPFLTYADSRDLREKVWRNYYGRGDNGDSHDNNGIITTILGLRAARAKLLGYDTHAHWRLEPQMAKTPEAAMDLMMRVWPKAVARVKEEVADMQRIADEEGAGMTIEPWDYRYYAEKVRKAKYDLDFNEVKPYMQLEKLREA